MAKCSRKRRSIVPVTTHIVPATTHIVTTTKDEEEFKNQEAIRVAQEVVAQLKQDAADLADVDKHFGPNQIRLWCLAMEEKDRAAAEKDLNLTSAASAKVKEKTLLSYVNAFLGPKGKSARKVLPPKLKPARADAPEPATDADALPLIKKKAWGSHRELFLKAGKTTLVTDLDQQGNNEKGKDPAAGSRSGGTAGRGSMSGRPEEAGEEKEEAEEAEEEAQNASDDDESDDDLEVSVEAEPETPPWMVEALRKHKRRYNTKKRWLLLRKYRRRVVVWPYDLIAPDQRLIDAHDLERLQRTFDWYVGLRPGAAQGHRPGEKQAQSRMHHTSERVENIDSDRKTTSTKPRTWNMENLVPLAEFRRFMNRVGMTDFKHDRVICKAFSDALAAQDKEITFSKELLRGLAVVRSRVAGKAPEEGSRSGLLYPAFERALRELALVDQPAARADQDQEADFLNFLRLRVLSNTFTTRAPLCIDPESPWLRYKLQSAEEGETAHDPEEGEASHDPLEGQALDRPGHDRLSHTNIKGLSRPSTFVLSGPTDGQQGRKNGFDRLLQTI
jgi:hypothetical protein